MSATILYVEDSASMRMMIGGVINSIGFTAIEAESGEQACELFPLHDIDIAVLDVNMEGIDGFETCRRLRKLANDDWFPVIYLSGTNSVENVVEGLDAGGDAYVTKPVNPRVLEAILKAMGRIADMKTKLNNANKKLERLAAYDSLTQVPNRRSFDEAAQRFTLQARREKTDLALLLIDIDDFEAYNDFYGHTQGDQCLVQVAATLNESLLRPIDFAARYAGEVFAVLLPITSKEGAENVADRIQQALADINILHKRSRKGNVLTVSIGIAMSQQGSTSPSKLVSNAEEALRLSKSQRSVV
jgi:diguanylate cyclase (GGDEF)-like protein